MDVSKPRRFPATTPPEPSFLSRAQEGIAKGAANSILIKVNQIGTLTETLDAMERKQSLGLRSDFSCRCLAENPSHGVLQHIHPCQAGAEGPRDLEFAP